VRLKLRGGHLDINEQQLDDVVLWTETSPSPTHATIRATSRKPAALRVWNAWRDNSGTMQAWIGNAGILVEEQSNEVTLKCSDGFDEPTFDDLIVKLTLGDSR
jgi:hypothetical protein